MESCQACSEFFNLSFEVAHSGQPAYRTCSFGERRKIKESKLQGCELCSKIFEFIEERYGSDYDAEPAKDRMFKTILYGSTLESDKRRAGRKQECASLISFKWVLGNGDVLQQRCFSVWVTEDEGSPGEENPLNKKGSLELQEAFELPSRILCLKDDTGTDIVKLVETKGSRGAYCALSHCWGRRNKHPLKTNDANIRDHLTDIPMSSLPKTFRDAIDLTRGVGIKYLWIDSLCIIQDDDSDWDHEAKKMASVYRRAALVIAAADAHDSTDGLFLARRPKPEVFHLPITSSRGHVMSTCFVAETSPQSIDWGIRGPLRERGWAFQEWYLARRLAFFTSTGIKWKCQRQEINERGNAVKLELDESVSWLHCLEIYSEKKLTVSSDRITALLGIAAELTKKTEDSFREDLGIWEKSLAIQLLWKQLEEPRGELSLPSWCWAAAGGKKDWMVKFGGRSRLQTTFDGITQAAKPTHSQAVSASGCLMPVTIGPQLEKCCIDNMWRVFDIEERAILSGNEWWFESGNIRGFPLCNPHEEHSVFGLAVLDIGTSCSECSCFILGSTDGRICDTDDYDYCHETMRSFKYCRKSRDLTTNYWALLLQPVEGPQPVNNTPTKSGIARLWQYGMRKTELQRKFKRVGIALLWRHNIKKGQFKDEGFEII
ncbi:HET-domain-containing protein [Fusarium austroafricanum]|uniref:HET-domain-containing protein n=1 Tax=Fusarium austroafricanum TaxID=2364996 RepID=A0A8H4KVM2_9HYPO|nr:HET-domain-containing protein [Fusarium austroafricanum]